MTFVDNSLCTKVHFLANSGNHSNNTLKQVNMPKLNLKMTYGQSNSMKIAPV